MIRYLQGPILDRDERTIIVLTGGVGYEVFVPNSILRSSEETIALFIHTHLREDTLTLYGFRTKNELNFFELLMNVSGIGPKMALDIVNEPLEKIQHAILTGNTTVLTQISGIGRKIADRMVLELKGKITLLEFEGVKTPTSSVFSPGELHPDVLSALENLGYKRNHIQRIHTQMEEEITETEALIRWFLQRL